MSTKNIELIKLLVKCRKQAIENTNNCMHPNCNEKSINSHILQRNGILSSIALDNSLWESTINHYADEYICFKKKGISKIYTFLGFCKQHDNSVFKKIESSNLIDFNDYKSCLLFALRTACNEYRIKEILIKELECINRNPNIYSIKSNLEILNQNKLALKDLSFYINSMWVDLYGNTESFVFENRELDLIEICLNSTYTYDTSKEIQNYILENGEDMKRTTEIFISFFPYLGKSILIMGYHKDDIKKAKPFVNLFIKEKIKSLKRRISSLIIFNCEVWVCSDLFYKKKFEGLNKEFFKAVLFSNKNGNERKTFNVDLFSNNFKEEFREFVNKNIK